MVWLWILASLPLLAGLWLFMTAPRLGARLPAELTQVPYAHRGLHNIKKGIPENSLSAFARAKERGYGMELDVHLSKDGTLFVSHDDTLLRCCGVDRRIEDCTDAELQAMHLEGTEETIPCLSDVFALIDGKVPLLIEAKAAGNSPALADALVAALKDYRGPYCVESFDPRFLLAFRRRAPKTVRGQLSGAINKHGGNLPAPVDFMMGHLLVCCLSRPHFIAYDYRDCRRPSFRFYRWFWRPALFLWTPRSAAARAEAQKERGILIFEETED